MLICVCPLIYLFISRRMLICVCPLIYLFISRRMLICVCPLIYLLLFDVCSSAYVPLFIIFLDVCSSAYVPLCIYLFLDKYTIDRYARLHFTPRDIRKTDTSAQIFLLSLQSASLHSTAFCNLSLAFRMLKQRSFTSILSSFSHSAF
jgi:hypothetical protein